MSLATTCPACGTCFRVVQDQLKVSEGWVRCGHCQDVFNALDGLFDLDAPTPAVAAAPPEAPPQWSDANALAAAGAPAATPSWTDDVPTAPTPSPFTEDDEAPAPWVGNQSDDGELPPVPRWRADTPLDVPVDGLPAAAVDDSASTGATEATEATAHTSTLPLAVDGQAATVPEPLADSDNGFLPSFLQREAAADEADTTPADPPPDSEPAPIAEIDPTGQPGFVRAAERRARWEQPAVQVVLGLLGLLLGGALVAQSAWHWRDRLAYSWPASKPALAMACAELDCTLQAPRRIDALVVDNTVLSRPPGSDGYQLTVTLHNRADHPVAVPHLALALSDVQGAVSVRRVLAPADFQVEATAAIPPQADVSWSLTFTLADSNGKTGAATGSTRAAGYTVAAFYP
ncbi:MAG: zinc-ribbon and DUF3426 domain-containing protein [Burkholderiales bacterium]